MRQLLLNCFKTVQYKLTNSSLWLAQEL